MCGISAILRARRRGRTAPIQTNSSSASEAPSGISTSTAAVNMSNESIRRQLLALAKRGPTVMGIQRIDVGSATTTESVPTAAATSVLSPQAIRDLIYYDPTEDVSAGGNKIPPAIVSKLQERGEGTGDSVTLIGSVLHLRGQGQPLKQPYTDAAEKHEGGAEAVPPCSSYLCWNGEVFGGSAVIRPEECDTAVVYKALRGLEAAATSSSSSSSAAPATSSAATIAVDARRQSFLDAVRALFESHTFEGPFAFIYYAASLRLTVFGRDVVGRRSLVVRSRGDCENGGEFIVSSVACAEAEEPSIAAANGQSQTAENSAAITTVTASSAVASGDALSWFPAGGQWAEVPTTGIFAVAMSDNANEHAALITDESSASPMAAPFFSVLASPWTFENRVHPLLTYLPPAATTTEAGESGETGLPSSSSSSSPATMWRFTLPSNKVYPFYNFQLKQLVTAQENLVPMPLRVTDATEEDGTSGKSAKEEKEQQQQHYYGYPSLRSRQLCLEALVRFPMKMLDLSTQIVKLNRYAFSPSVDSPFIAAQLYMTALLDAVSRRVEATTRRATVGGHSVMVMLSGGIDSTVLAALTHYALPHNVPIEVVNVAFVDKCHDTESALTPDRIASYQAFAELLDLPGAAKRRWRFVEVNVCPHRLQRHKRRVLSLVAPRGTVMDHDIGCALWFAAQGVGVEVPTEDVLFRAKYFSAKAECSSSSSLGGGGAAGQSITSKLVRRAVVPQPTPTAADAQAASAPSSSGACCPAEAAANTAAGTCIVGQKRSRSPVAGADGGERTEKAAAGSSEADTVVAAAPADPIADRYGALIAVLQSEGFEVPDQGTHASADPTVTCGLPPMMGGASDYDYCRNDDHHLLPMAKHQFSSTKRSVGGALGYDCTDSDDDGNQTSAGGDESSSSPLPTPKMVMLATLGKEYSAALTPIWKDALGYKKLGFYLNDAAKDGVITFGNKGSASSQYVQLRRAGDIKAALATIAERRKVCESPDAVPYTCQSPIVIMGMGADETLGGYVRHERLAAQHGWRGLQRELQSDFARLWERNLGRDDRVISDAGREARFPFLDERVLYAVTVLGAAVPTAVCEFKGAVPPTVATDAVLTIGDMTTGKPLVVPPSASSSVEGAAASAKAEVVEEKPSAISPFTHGPTGSGIGDKKILRTVARMIGLNGVSTLQKRAVQFGSRIADPKQRGSAALE